MWNLWIRPPKRGGNDCLRYAISWLNKKCYKDITNYFSCNMNLMNQKNYCQAITKIHGILKLWRMRNFFIEGKILVFTTLAISKLVYLVLLTVAPDHIIDEKVARIQKWFIRHNWFSIKKDFNDNGYQKSLWFIRSYFCHFCIEKIGFGNNLVSWIKTLITKQESCIISNGNTTQYFHLERRACQGDPISTCIFILALKVLSFLFRSNKDIKCLTIFDHLFLYTGYADDTFFFENRKSTKKLVETFALFFSFLSLKAGISKCEIYGLDPHDVRFKFLSLQCSWVKKLYDDTFREWKTIHLHLLGKYFGFSFKFHSNLHFESKVLENFPSFLQTNA